MFCISNVFLKQKYNLARFVSLSATGFVILPYPNVFDGDIISSKHFHHSVRKQNYFCRFVLYFDDEAAFIFTLQLIQDITFWIGSVLIEQSWIVLVKSGFI